MNKKITIYTALGIDGYELCQPINQNDFDIIPELINGFIHKDVWKPITVKLIKKDMGKELVESDSPWFGSDALIFKENVIKKLGAFLEKYGEILPLDGNKIGLYIYNPKLCTKALDIEKSELIRLNSGKIISIKKYVFNKEKIRDLGFFKIDNLRVSPTFINQDFVNKWNLSKFSGLEFVKVWAE